MIKRLFLLVCMACAAPSFAATEEDDAPIPYGDDDSQREDQPRKKKRRRVEDTREEEEEALAAEETLTHLDDPNLGLGLDFMSGVALLSASQGGVDPRYYLGARFTWEFGRLIPDEYVREMLFVDLMWMWSQTQDGTAQVKQVTSLHNFVVAPAFNLRIKESFMSFYAQVGAGFDYSYSVLTLRNADTTSSTTLGGTKFLFQYGVGLRGRPALTRDESVRLQFRIELFRYVRGYLHDTMIGGSLGLIF